MAFDQPKISKSKQSRGTSSSQSVSSTKHTENDSDVNRPSVLPTSHAPSATNAVKKNKRKKNNTNELWSDQHRPQCQVGVYVGYKTIWHDLLYITGYPNRDNFWELFKWVN